MRNFFLVMGALGGLVAMLGAAAAFFFWKIDGLVAVCFAAGAASFSAWCVREGVKKNEEKDER